MKPFLRSLAARFLRRGQTEEELQEELHSHIGQRAADLERSGLDHSEAARRARIEFGSTERFKEECREALGGNIVETLFRDLRFSFRMLRKSPAFSTLVVLTIAFGIGASTAISVPLIPFSSSRCLIRRPTGW